MLEKICIILLINLIFYFKTLGYKYVSDDIASYTRTPHNNKWMQRFLVLEGHAKSTPVIDHAITMVLHALVCVGIYLGFGHNDISFLAAILFSFNPINNQGAVWISGRGYVFSALGMTWALALPVISPIFLFVAMYSNAGFLSPLAFLGSPHPWMFIVVPFIWAYHWKNFRKNVYARMSTEMFTEDKRFHLKKLILVTKTFGFYLSHSLVPFKNTFYHSVLESMAGSGKKRAYKIDRFFICGVIAILASFWYIVTHKWDMISFGILWWCVGIAPYLNLFRMSQETAERYCYLPNIGLMFIVATFIHSNPFIVSFFITMYATKMWFYMDAYQDEYYLIETACLNSPDSWFAWHMRALKRWHTQSYREAMILWTMAKLISPNEFKLLFNLATVLAVGGQKEESLMFLNLAEKNVPEGQEKDCTNLISEFRKGNVTILG